MKNYKCIFFDLDHTLWDYETNSRDTLNELYATFKLFDHGVHNFESFLQQFKKVNTELWDLYDRGIITSEIIRKERFKRILDHFRVEHETLCLDLSHEYLYNCPKRGVLLPHAIETLKYLAAKYSMTVVTNGFEEIQHLKLTAGNLHSYFAHIVTSQKAGYKKPAKEIFEYAMDLNKIGCHEAVMIGDNLVTDMGGALNASIDTIYFNPDRVSHQVNVKHEINNLAQLREIL